MRGDGDAGSTSSTSALSWQAGIIPADAGSTELDPDDRPIHPGSSPRMRGAHHETLHLARGMGIIPADAGSTSLLLTGEATPGDHPRGCGEHDLDTITRRKWMGSSPRMRGAR